jgi:hypothetical protein
MAMRPVVKFDGVLICLLGSTLSLRWRASSDRAYSLRRRRFTILGMLSPERDSAWPMDRPSWMRSKIRPARPSSQAVVVGESCDQAGRRCPR